MNPLARALLVSVVGALAIAVGAQITVPMVPVPMTLQTLAVITVALIGGPGGGAGAASAYLLLVLLGLPVLADGASHGGLGFLFEPTAGYVVGFVPAATAAGWLARAPGDALGRLPRSARWLGGGLVAHGLVLAIGVTVLARHIGAATAIEHGLLPFLAGAAVKSVAAAGLAAVWGQLAEKVEPSDHPQ